jgi:hypothetical protein
VSALLAALRRELHELEEVAKDCRARDEFLPAVIAEEVAASVEQQIAALEAQLEGASV